MFTPDQYQLLDFGSGRKLERFGAYIVDRPTPAAVAARRDPQAWERADARYERAENCPGQWSFNRSLAPAWTVRCGQLAFDLKFSRFGQVGLFPEQASSWRWIAEQLCAAGVPCKVLNLFAYTGGSTLAAAGVGAEVTHVDAASTSVAWARRNAEISKLAGAPIRWITDDVLKFARRELKRGQRYDAVILDPPSYGKGPGGETWKLVDQLGELLDLCGELTEPDRLFMLLTCHSGELAKASGLLKAVLTQAPRLRDAGAVQAADLFLTSVTGAKLHCGAGVRWTTKPSASTASQDRTRARRDL